jgi:hypothetical protein
LDELDERDRNTQVRFCSYVCMLCVCVYACTLA